MIATAYCLQFYPPLVYESQKIRVDLDGKIFESRGRLILDPGWTKCAKEDDEEEKEENKASQNLPAVRQGDAVSCSSAELLKKKTTAPPRFTEGSLIEAMANVHRFVDDAAAKATLKENEGIGTEATRAGVLEVLKKRKYLAPSGKAIVSTPLGGKVIDMTPKVLKDPVTTAQWESKLESIAQGKVSLVDFMSEQAKVLPDMLAALLSAESSMSAGKPAFPCPTCGKALRQIKGKNGPFWGCTGYPECSTNLPDNNGKPGTKKEAPQATQFACPKCGKPLNFRRGTGKNGKPYELFSCSGYPGCKESFFGKNGKPDFK